MTPFQQAVQQAVENKLKTPTVTLEGQGQVDYFGYQLAVHKFNLSLMAKGISSKGVKLGDLKKYYGLKGRTAADCLPQFIQIIDNYTTALKS